MKLKKALLLSLIVNAIFMVAVGFFVMTDLAPDSAPPLFIYPTNAPAAQMSRLSAGAQ